MKNQEIKKSKRNGKELKRPQKRGLILLLFIVILIPAIWVLFLNKESDHTIASKTLNGKWLRADGPYTIEITSVKDDGLLEVAYFNPNPIAGAKGSWRMNDEKLRVFVVLNDINYQGSTYELTYNERSKNLVGLFYQAKVKQTFDVYFTKNK